MSQDIRRGEDKVFSDRSDRVCQKGAYWYFHTREEVMIGPFDSKELAIKGANDYVGFAIDADPDVLKTLAQ
jgi:hypothetical protein